ncbi:hypothetical protein DSO57_1005589 [Entomophthora muscae]|uniref:Uncharacterized protein n=1 Tax=Entomophthora muscae TaxID=34485 RepID=A0ACC2UTZ5_9FUNG|nr:hypothetical protein DSO57_1005589 [Entomophthora muscae]
MKNEPQGEVDESRLSDVIDDKTRKRKAPRKKEPASKVKKVKKPRQKKPVDPNAPKPITAFSAPVILSEKLSRLLKADRLPRTEVIKRLWVYIKENKLQDPKDGRNILCDPTLKDLFQVDEVTSFQMAKIIGPHLTKLPAEELQALKDQSKLNISNPLA